MNSGPLVAEVQMLSHLLDAEQLKPRRRTRYELHPLHEPWSNCVRRAASDLRRHCQKEFVHSFCRQKLSEQRGPTLVEEHSYSKLRIQQAQDRQRRDAATARFQSMYLNRV